MQHPAINRQSGYMLLFIMIALMGIGGVVAANFTHEARQQVDQERYLHNQRVLEEAKRALLLYAYQYSTNFPDRGPGRLPCPDTDNDGLPGNGGPPVANCGGLATPDIGRFPHLTNFLSTSDLRDASGERLWYAVSSSYDNEDDDRINSDTQGTITIHDRVGRILYDNSLVGTPGVEAGVAAVIIAPGPEIDRAGIAQNRAADINDPVNYLDLNGALDNAVFDNTAGSNNGFVLGPVYDGTGNVIVNDQMIVITTAEIRAMAERATLEAYAETIRNYQQQVWAVPTDYRYPWLDPYAGIGADLDLYNLPPGSTEGRLPFMNYYQDHDSHTLVTDLVVNYDIDMNLTDTSPDGGNYLNAFDAAFGAQTFTIQNANLSFLAEDFADTSTTTGDNLGTLVVNEDDIAATVTAGETVDRTLYFWDGCAACDLPSVGWQLCALPATNETFCAKDENAPYNFEAFTGDWDDHADIRIRFVTLRRTITTEFELGLDYSQAITVLNTNPPVAGGHADRQSDLAAALNGIDVDVFADDVDDFRELMNIDVMTCEQDNMVEDEYNVPSFNPNADSVNCLIQAPIIALSAAPTLPPNSLDITVDYFPEPPIWVRNDRWNDSILVAYDNDHQPDGSANCADTLPNCLTVWNQHEGTTNNNISVFIAAGRNPADGADLANIFEGRNDIFLDGQFDASPDSNAIQPLFDDTLLVMEEN